ncbi:MAG: hypothetical protein RIF46_14280 [Cyclobacteriaceae bacterium]
MKTLKSIFFMTSFLLANFFFGQEGLTNIEVKAGTIEPVIQQVKGQTASQQFMKVKEWINYNNKNADEVIGSLVENEFIRFTGVSPNFSETAGYNYDLEYTIKIDFKEDRYRLTVEQLRSGVNGIFADFNLGDYYKANGEPRPLYSNFTTGIDKTLNDLNTSLFNFIIGKSEELNDDW